MQDPVGEIIDAHHAVSEAVRLTRRGRFDVALEIFEEHLSILTKGDVYDRRMAVSAFSYYGVCIAKVRRRYSEALQYCRLSVEAEFLDPEHRCNLAMVYLEKNRRKEAVKNLTAALRLAPTNPRINSLAALIGRRRRPVIPFLPRRHPVNVWLGKLRHAKH